MGSDGGFVYCHAGPFEERQQAIIDQLLGFHGDILSLGEVVPYWAVAFYYLMGGKYVTFKRSPKDDHQQVTITVGAPDTDLNFSRMHDFLFGLSSEGLKGWIGYCDQAPAELMKEEQVAPDESYRVTGKRLSLSSRRYST
jgi:hypothetical protein